MTLLDTARALQELSGKATQGPWTIGYTRERAYKMAPTFHETPVHVGEGQTKGNAFAIVSLGGRGASSMEKQDVEANAELIAMFGTHGPALVAALLKAHEALKESLAEMEHHDSGKVMLFQKQISQTREALSLMESPL